ncbi:hypothetical protein AWZ03_003306 [Drosophila navojoa]|uniref:Uncharacterized protein n=1 Tax=Drosophila navojoa TaxID=7232 RepID=A0A484BRM0_DRONA|nr:hypothetical protein AWZ03_003306 [Drosophila navojoa]
MPGANGEPKTSSLGNGSEAVAALESLCPGLRLGWAGLGRSAAGLTGDKCFFLYETSTGLIGLLDEEEEEQRKSQAEGF